jgi:F-type H+-transporting ATPase subunit b
MEFLKQTTLIITNKDKFTLNTNIFETNIINIAIFIVMLFVLAKPLLKQALYERQNLIIANLEDSEKRLNEGKKRLLEAKKQFTQVYLIIGDIKKEATMAKQNLLNNAYKTAKIELNRKFIIASTGLKTREKLTLNEIKQNISLLALKQVISKIKQQSGNEEEQINYMQESIKKLGRL